MKKQWPDLALKAYVVKYPDGTYVPCRFDRAADYGGATPKTPSRSQAYRYTSLFCARQEASQVGGRVVRLVPKRVSQ